MGELAKTVFEERGFNFRKLNCILVFLNLAKLCSCIILLCFDMFLLLYSSIVFLKSEHGKLIIYVQNFFVYFEYDGFLTSFIIFMIFMNYVMQVCEFCFTGFALIQLVFNDLSGHIVAVSCM